MKRFASAGAIATAALLLMGTAADLRPAAVARVTNPAPCTTSCSLMRHQMSGMSTSMEQISETKHMRMTPHRQLKADDRKKADAILAQLRAAVAKYQDVDAAIADGYKQFLPKVPQRIYHFTSWKNAIANEFGFDAARPTSLMYEQTDTGFKLVGAMYTAPKRSTLDDLDARVPLSVATWHEHINFCAGPPGSQPKDYFGPGARFGLAGSIDNEADCSAAGGKFQPVLYNWMLHVWPNETDPSKVWATEDRPGAMSR